MSATLQMWMSLGISARLLDMTEIDTSTAPGRWAVRFLEKAQALADAAHGEIVKAGHARSKARGKPTGKAPYGYRIARNGGRKRFVPDPQERAVGAKIVEWKQAGYSWEQIRAHLLEHRIETKHGAMWSLRKIQDAYHGELQLQATEQARQEAAGDQGSGHGDRR